jgi:hypothetical protein
MKVSQAKINEMKAMGMSKAIEHANSGKADPEFLEAAKRFYTHRIKVGAQKEAINRAMGAEKAPGGQAGAGDKSVTKIAPAKGKAPTPTATTTSGPPAKAPKPTVVTSASKPSTPSYRQPKTTKAMKSYGRGSTI